MVWSLLTDDNVVVPWRCVRDCYLDLTIGDVETLGKGAIYRYISHWSSINEIIAYLFGDSRSRWPSGLRRQCREDSSSSPGY